MEGMTGTATRRRRPDAPRASSTQQRRAAPRRACRWRETSRPAAVAAAVAAAAAAAAGKGVAAPPRLCCGPRPRAPARWHRLMCWRASWAVLHRRSRGTCYRSRRRRLPPSPHHHPHHAPRPTLYPVPQQPPPPDQVATLEHDVLRRLLTRLVRLTQQLEQVGHARRRALRHALRLVPHHAPRQTMLSLFVWQVALVDDTQYPSFAFGAATKIRRPTPPQGYNHCDDGGFVRTDSTKFVRGRT